MNDAKSFVDDLSALQHDVADDVRGILTAAKERKAAPKPKPAVQPESVEPSPAQPRVSSDEPQDVKLAGEERIVSKARVADEALENVTTRLSRSINERLTEAALRQRLKKLEPSSRQGIMEAAVREWLTRHGYK